MVRILVLNRRNNLSDEQMEYQLLDRMSYHHFGGLHDVATIPDRTTVWAFKNRIGKSGVQTISDGVAKKLLRQGFITRGDQTVDVTLVPAPKQRIRRKEKELIDQRASCLNNCRRPCAGRKIWMRPGRKSTARATSATSYPLTSTTSTNCFVSWKQIPPVRTGDSLHFDTVFDRDNTSADAYADRGYPSNARETWLSANGYRN